MRICPDCASSYAANERFCHADGATLLDVGDDPLIGKTIGSYRLVRMLGEGGMGQVYLGVHPGIGSRVAIKVLDAAAASRKDLVERFFAEAMAVNRIRHENIVNVLDLDNLTVDGGGTRPYIVMEHLEGRPLSSVLAHFGRLPQGTLSQLAREILGALAAAHNAGIIHRDLKPDNVFVSPQGRAKVLDFGIAKLLPNAAIGGAGEGANFTQTGMLLGTPSYMAPEQAKGETVTPATDLYAVGVILFEALTGELPFRGETLYDLLNQHVTATPPSPRSFDPSISPGLEAIILRALAKDPAARFRSADEMANALLTASAMFPGEAWASISLTGDEPALVADPTPRPTPSGNLAPAPEAVAHTPRVAAPRARKNRAGLLVLGLVLLIGAAVAVAVVVGSDKTAPDAETVASAETTDEAGKTTESQPKQLAAQQPDSPPDKVEESKPPANDDKTTVKPAANPKTNPTKPPVQAKTKPASAPNTDQKKAAPKTTPLKPKDANGVTYISTQEEANKKGYKTFTAPAGVNTKQFDGSAYLGKARTLARKMMSDAKLTEFNVSGVGPNGKTNLHKGYAEAEFWFRSPSRSKRDPNLPKGAEGEDVICMVYVEINNGTAEVSPATRENCLHKHDRFSRNPRCSLAQVWKKAYERKAPKGNWVAKLTYQNGWFFSIDDIDEDGTNFSESIPDDC